MGDTPVTGSTVGGAAYWSPLMEEIATTFAADLFQEDILRESDDMFSDKSDS